MGSVRGGAGRARRRDGVGVLVGHGRGRGRFRHVHGRDLGRRCRPAATTRPAASSKTSLVEDGSSLANRTPPISSGSSRRRTRRSKSSTSPRSSRRRRLVAPLVAVDNTFATPLRQRPLELGADIVVHSVTKLLAGHSDLVMGAVVARDNALVEQLREQRSLHGAIPGPMETFLALRGSHTGSAARPCRGISQRARRTPGNTPRRQPGALSRLWDDDRVRCHRRAEAADFVCEAVSCSSHGRPSAESSR